jgi:hypothetical protein
MNLLEEIEEELMAKGMVPISRSAEIVEVHAGLVERWQRGENGSIQSLLPRRAVSLAAKPASKSTWRQSLEQAIEVLQTA